MEQEKKIFGLRNGKSKKWRSRNRRQREGEYKTGEIKDSLTKNRRKRGMSLMAKKSVRKINERHKEKEGGKNQFLLKGSPSTSDKNTQREGGSKVDVKRTMGKRNLQIEGPGKLNTMRKTKFMSTEKRGKRDQGI